MKHNDWTEQMRQRLDKVEMPVPDNLWEAIGQKLDEQVAVRQGVADDGHKAAKQRPVLSWRRYAAAASVALLAGVALWWYAAGDTPAVATLQPGAVAGRHGQAATQAYGKVARLLAHDGPVVASPPQAPGRMAPASSARPVTARQGHGAMEQGAACHDVALMKEEEKPADVCATDAHMRQNETAGQGATAAAKRAKTTRRGDEPLPQPQAAYAAMASRRTHEGCWQVAGGTGGALSANTASSQSLLMTTFAGMNVENNGGEMFYTAFAQRSDNKPAIHHNMPLQFALTASYRLSERLALTSGVVYTLATSTFDYGSYGSQYTERQTLHYVGVPVQVGYTLWGNQLLRTYVAGGAQADFNVSAKMKGEGDGQAHDIDNDRVQFSVGGHVGAQLNVARHVGIYVEPGLRYYFDNNSRVSTVFKEHPCNFSLQVGLRYDIK